MKPPRKTEVKNLYFMKIRRIVLYSLLFCACGIHCLRAEVAAIPESGVAQQQTKKILNGTIVDQQGDAVPGAAISIKGTTVGTIAKDDGSFEISTNIGASIVVSYLGYISTTYIVDNKNNVTIVLKEDVQLIDEVVVVGYATQKRVNLSGAVNTVSTKEITSRPVTSLTNALQGTVPGMTVITRPGDVGGDIGSINVRGRGNLGTSSPFYVVDGVPVSANDFARISTSDIESISILKDAAASAIYGSRAAYGVILVTTKRGNSGKVQVQYNGSYGWQSPTNLPDLLGSSDYAMLYNEAEKNAGKTTLRFTDEELKIIADGSNLDLYPNTDWYKLGLRSTAPLWDSQLSVNGGTDLARYFVSAGIMDQGSLVPGKDLSRYTFRTNINSKISDYFSLSTNVSFTRDEMDNENGTMNFVSLQRMVPLQVNKQSNGDWGTINGGRVDAANSAINPIRILQEGGRQEYYQNRFLGNLSGTLTPINGWNINGLLSYKSYNGATSTFTNTLDPLVNFLTGQVIASTAVTPNQLEESWLNSSNFLAELTTSYERYFNVIHYAKVFLGTSYEDYNESPLKAIRKDFVNNSLGAIDGGSTIPDNTTTTGNKYQKKFQSYFGRFNYSFKDRYLFEANMRIDGSSQFASEERWGYFPSVSGAWRITQESFVPETNWLNELKLRGSWGQLGNINNVGYYDFYDGLASGTTAVLDQKKISGVYPNKVANPNLTWENVTMTNGGLDGSFFKNKLFVQLDVYHKMTDNILLPDPGVPDEAGLTDKQTPSRNLGKVQNNGLELAISYNGKLGNDFSYSIGGNLSKIWNKIIKLDGISDYYTTGTYYIMKEGESIGAFYMWESDGLFATDADVKDHAFQSAATKAGDIKYIDQNDDGVIDGDDRVIVGNDVPYLTYAININLSYKGFDFSMIGQGVPNVQVYLDNEASQAFFNSAGVHKFHLDRWTTDNPNSNANMPRTLLSANSTHNLKQSDFWLFDASYFRIKSLSLGYNLPASILNTVGIQRARVYVTSNNLFTIRADKRLKDFDPESASYRSSYPQVKTVSVGASITF